jgi:hypothetical protein
MPRVRRRYRRGRARSYSRRSYWPRRSRRSQERLLLWIVVVAGLILLLLIALRSS